MRAYSPPTRHLSTQGLPFRLDRIQSLPDSLIVPVAAIPPEWSERGFPPPLIATACLVASLGKGPSDHSLAAKAFRWVEAAVNDGLDADRRWWPRSLASCSQALDRWLAPAEKLSGQEGLASWTADTVRWLGVDFPAWTLRGFGVSSGVATIQWALASGLPVAVGISVPDDWDDAGVMATGLVPQWSHTEEPVDVDCIVINGYDNNRLAFMFAYTQGPAYGDSGEGWIPYTNIASPLWCHERIVIAPVASIGGY